MVHVAAPIRIGDSQPEVHDAASFLTTLPPELRNKIYEYAFVLEDEMIIVESVEYTRSPEWEPDEHSDYKWDLDDADAIETENFLGHGISLQMALLRTCRQVYSEAVGILMGKMSLRSPSQVSITIQVFVS